jgi:hypothetical protein
MKRADGMDTSLRIVTQIPMSEIWDAEGKVSATKRRTLTSNDIAAMLRQGLIRFVVADCGDPLNWISLRHCYDFWKTEVKSRTVDIDAFDPTQFADAYCYVASEWTDGQPTPIVLLEKYH